MQGTNKPFSLPQLSFPISILYVEGITMLRFIEGKKYVRYVVVDRNGTLTLIFKKPERLELEACYCGKFQTNPDFGNALEFFVMYKLDKKFNCKPDFRLGLNGLVLV